MNRPAYSRRDEWFGNVRWTIFTHLSQSKKRLRYKNDMCRSRIFWRLFGAHSVLLAVSFAVLGWLLIGRMEKHLLRETQRGLEIKTQLIWELVQRSAPADLQDLVSRIAEQTAARITLIQSDGTVIADSDERPSRMENHLERPEVQLALRADVGESVRFSGTVHQPMMYVARRTSGVPVGFVRIALPLTAVAAELRWLHGVVWTGAGIALGGALLLSLLVARRITRPIVELTEAADSIARGDYGRKILIASSDEVGALATSFNAMSEACAAQIAQRDHDRELLRATFRSMVEGIVVLDGEQTVLFANDAARELLGMAAPAPEGRKLWQFFRHRQLTEAVEKVLASDEPYRCEMEWSFGERRAVALQGARLRDKPDPGAVLVFHDITDLRKLETVRQDFIANVSHELKTPLAAIQATAETLLDGALNDAQHNVRFLETIRDNADRLHRLVVDLLSLGRVESGQAPLELEAIPLFEAAAACISRHEAQAKAKGLTLILKPTEQPVTAIADRDALAEILDNLVDNAIKYTPAAGTICLCCQSENGRGILQVSDSGVGIPAHELPRIFERFYRVDKARSRELGGTGLGLSIVKHLAQALGGSVAVSSELGRGSVFSVHLPLCRHDRPRDATAGPVERLSMD